MRSAWNHYIFSFPISLKDHGYTCCSAGSPGTLQSLCSYWSFLLSLCINIVVSYSYLLLFDLLHTSIILHNVLMALCFVQVDSSFLGFLIGFIEHLYQWQDCCMNSYPSYIVHQQNIVIKGIVNCKHLPMKLWLRSSWALRAGICCRACHNLLPSACTPCWQCQYACLFFLY